LRFSFFRLFAESGRISLRELANILDVICKLYLLLTTAKPNAGGSVVCESQIFKLALFSVERKRLRKPALGLAAGVMAKQKKHHRTDIAI
jgi:hypothetical protein